MALLRVRETVSTHLPEEFAGSDEGSGMLELPANDVRPLVETEREVAVSTDPSGVGLVRIRAKCVPGYMMVSEVGRMATGS